MSLICDVISPSGTIPRTVFHIYDWWSQWRELRLASSHRMRHTDFDFFPPVVQAVRWWAVCVQGAYAPLCERFVAHYRDVIMGTFASQITSLTIVYSTVYSGADQRKHQSSAWLVFVRGIHRWPVNFPHKGPVTRKMFPSAISAVSLYLVINKEGTDFSARLGQKLHLTISQVK